MELKQSFTVPYDRAAVWSFFHDTPAVVACLPGATLTAPVENGLLALAMTIKLGPIVASFAGDGEMTLDEATYRGAITGGGVDRKSASRVKGVAAFSLNQIEAGVTQVDVEVDYTISGMLAQFSRGNIVKDLAARLTEAFAGNLREKLEQAAANSASVVEASVESMGVVGMAYETPPVASPAIAAATANVASAPVSSSGAAVAAAAPLDVGNLFWQVLWSRVKALFGIGSR